MACFFGNVTRCATVLQGKKERSILLNSATSTANRSVAHFVFQIGITAW